MRRRMPTRRRHTRFDECEGCKYERPRTKHHADAYTCPSCSRARSPVSSCDQCRVKKMKCDAKERPHGQTCANCERYKRKCTFRDKESDMQSKLEQQQLKANRPRSRTNGSASTTFDPSVWGEASAMASYPRDVPAGGSGAWLWGNHGRSMSLPGLQHSGSANGYFAVPTTLYSTPTQPEAVIELLLTRFYDNAPSSLAVVIAPPRAQMMQRFRRSHAAPLPLYLVQVVAACALATAFQPEPELRAWAITAWREAVEAVQARLSASSMIPDLDVIRALLLLTITSAGSPAATERLTSFHTALGLAHSLQLMSRDHNEACHPEERAQRLQIFWILYVVDKVIAVAHESAAMLPMCEMPFLAVSDMEMLGVDKSDADTVHGLALATLDLMRILEAVQRDLYGAPASTTFPTNASAHAVIQPLEQQLEDWCKSSRVILSQGETPFTRRMAASVISLLHLVQLQLYSFPLRLEATLTTSGTFPITFGTANLKALVGSIESSLHLIRRGSNVSGGVNASNRVAVVTQAINKLHPSTTPMTFDIFLADRGATFLRFLSMAWSGWCGGEGIFNFVPQQQQDKEADVAESAAQSEQATPQQPGQPSRLPATEGFAERRGSVSTSLGRARVMGGKKKTNAPPAPLALGQGNANARAGSNDFPQITTAMVMESLGLPMTPAHQLFSDMAISNQAAAPVATPLAHDWSSLLEQMGSIPEIRVDGASNEQILDSGPAPARDGHDLTNMLGLGFDLQYPLTSPLTTTNFSFQAPPPPPPARPAFPSSIGEDSMGVVDVPRSTSPPSPSLSAPSPSTSAWSSWDSQILAAAAASASKPVDETDNTMDTFF